MKYIPADKLIAEIEQLKETNKTSKKHVSEYVQGGIYGFDLAIEKTLAIITTLQQEQPEVDLEKEIDEKWDEFVSSEGEREDFTNIARHFAEWGAIHLNAKNEE